MTKELKIIEELIVKQNKTVKELNKINEELNEKFLDLKPEHKYFIYEYAIKQHRNLVQLEEANKEIKKLYETIKLLE